MEPMATYFHQHISGVCVKAKEKSVRVQDSLRWRRPDAGRFRLSQRVSPKVPSRKRKETGSGGAKTGSEAHEPPPRSHPRLFPSSRHERAPDQHTLEPARTHTCARTCDSELWSLTDAAVSEPFVQTAGIRSTTQNRDSEPKLL